MHRGVLAFAAFAVALIGLPQHANAVLFDFAFQAEFVVGEGAWDAKFPTGYTVGGLTVTASATGTANSKAYLDEYDAGRPAGLGVCSFANAACAGNSDDNVGYAQDNSANPIEKLILTFSTAVQLTNLSFRDRDHFAFNGSLLIDGTSYNVVGGNLNVALLGTSFEFQPISTNTDINRDFYIGTVTAVPGPIVGAGLPGLMMAFGAMLAWRRRQSFVQKTAVDRAGSA